MPTKRKHTTPSPSLIDTMKEAYRRLASSPNQIDQSTLLNELPQGALSGARYDEERQLIAFTINDRNERFIEPEGFLLLRTLTMFNTAGLYLDKSSAIEAERRDYLEVFDAPGAGITALRLLADAQTGEKVKQTGDHHDLRASNLTITRGSKRDLRGRREGYAAALDAYDRNAADWELSAHLNRWEYQIMLRNAFRLYDLRHSHHYLKAIPDAAA